MDQELKKPEFWAAHYYLSLADEERDSSDLVGPLFGLSDEAVEAYYSETLVQPEEEARPLWLPLADSYSAGVEYAACGDAGDEVRFVISHDSWAEPELLGFESPHFALPAFRWQEVTLLHAVLVKEVGRDAAAAAGLLLFPAVYLTSAAESADARQHLQQWWQDLPYVRVDSELLAKNIVAYRGDTEVRWWKDDALGWINDSAYSFRNPHTRMCAFSDRRFARVRELFSRMEQAA